MTKYYIQIDKVFNPESSQFILQLA